MMLPSDSNELISKDPDAGVSGPTLALELEREDLETRLRIVKRKEKRHLLWAILGLSPGAVLPALGLMREGSTGLLLLLGGLVVVYQGYLWNVSARKAERLENQLHLLSERD